MNISAQEEHFGQVVSISGMDIIVEMKQELLKSNLEQRIVGDGQTVLKLFVGTVGDIFLIGDPATDAFHYAIFEEVKLVSEVEDQEKTGAPYIISSKKQKAIAIAKIIGYQDQRIKEKLSFRRGIGHYPKFNSKCYLLTSQEKKDLFALEGQGIRVGHMSSIQEEEVVIHTDKFLSKHSVILGSTGSGKSCTVASILQKLLRAHRYSHVVFFDLHNEYSAAVSSDDFNHRVNKFSANDFSLPYWFLNFEEFQSVFLGDIDLTKNNDGIRILKEQILKLKENEHSKVEHNVGEIPKININSPLYFSIDELIQELKLLNKKTLWKSDNISTFKQDIQEYLPSTGSKKVKREDKQIDDYVIQDQNYYNKLNQVIEKLQSIRNDRRFNFLFSENHNSSESFIGYLSDILCIPANIEQKQITILDLSGLPSEITPVIIGMLARICFEFKIWEEDPKKIPLYLVFEEAHNYIPRDTTSITKLPKRYIERIAKEGRKYGISQLIISQRPSDLSTTIVSQCSNFFVLRVTNPDDQTFIRKVLPDHLNALTSMIPFFQNGEVLIAGECVPIPIKAAIDLPNPLPNSSDVSFSDAWSNFVKYDIKDTILKWWEVKEDE